MPLALQIRAEFERRKDEGGMRKRYDPREHLKAVEVRAAAASDAATRMAGDIAEGALDPAKPGFHQGNLGGGAPADASPAAEADAEPAAVSANGAEHKVRHSCLQGFTGWGFRCSTVNRSNAVCCML